MDCIDNWCPGCISGCLRVVCVYVTKKCKKKEKAYDGLNELEEE